ncbi:MAG: pilus assembly FimT family protein [Armatimonadota bacterium]
MHLLCREDTTLIPCSESLLGRGCRVRATTLAFTLIELMVVLFFMVVGASLVVPRMPALLEGAKMRNAARNVAALVRSARELAVLREEPIALRYDQNYGFIIERVETEETVAAEEARTESEAAEEEKKPQIPEHPFPLPSGITVTVQTEEERSQLLLPSEGDELVFTPDGRCANARILLADSHGTGGLAVRVDLHGASVTIEGSLEEQG